MSTRSRQHTRAAPAGALRRRSWKSIHCCQKRHYCRFCQKKRTETTHKNRGYQVCCTPTAKAAPRKQKSPCKHKQARDIQRELGADPEGSSCGRNSINLSKTLSKSSAIIRYLYFAQNSLSTK